MTIDVVGSQKMTRVLTKAGQTRTIPQRTSYIGGSRFQKLLLLLADAAILGAGFGVVAIIDRFTDSIPPTSEQYAVTGAFAAFWLMLLWAFGAYSLDHQRAGSTEYRRTVNASLATAGTVGVTCYLLGYDYPRTFLILWILIGILALCLARLVRRRAMQRLHRRDLFVTPVLIAGNGHHADEIARVLERESWLGYRVRGVITNDRVGSTLSGLPVLGDLAGLPALVESTDAHAIVFAEGSFGSAAEYRRLAWHMEKSHLQMIVAPTLADISAERLDLRPVAGLPLVHVARPTAMKSLRRLKRSADILGSALLLLLGAPLLLITMLTIKLEDGGPVLFRQRRVGLEGKEFDCLKLRSMSVDAEARLAALKDQNEGAGVLFKMKNDPRITRVGRLIRRYSIDELPQLWNVLVGDMSLVGPRPALPTEVERYEPDARRRLRVRPGLTGLWQVSGRSSLSWEDTVRLDLYYVDNWSLVQDLMILLRTARAVVGSSGAY